MFLLLIDFDIKLVTSLAHGGLITAGFSYNTFKVWTVASSPKRESGVGVDSAKSHI